MCQSNLIRTNVRAPGFEGGGPEKALTLQRERRGALAGVCPTRPDGSGAARPCRKSAIGSQKFDPNPKTTICVPRDLRSILCMTQNDGVLRIDLFSCHYVYLGAQMSSLSRVGRLSATPCRHDSPTPLSRSSRSAIYCTTEHGQNKRSALLAPCNIPPT